MRKITHDTRGIFMSCLLSQAVFAIFSVVFLLIFCAIAFSLDDPDSVSIPLSLCALYLSAVIGGIAAVKFSADGIASGALSGLFSAVIIFVMSLLPLPASGFALPMSLVYILLIIPASLLGSVIGHKRSGRPSGKKKKAMRIK